MSTSVTETRDDISYRVPEGWWQTNNAAKSRGWPDNSGSWTHLISATYNQESGPGYWAMQMAGGFFDNDHFYVRKTNTNGLAPWRELIHTGNLRTIGRAAANPLYAYGFVGDGNSRPISSITSFNGIDTTGYSLGQWQAMVWQVGSLSDEIDGVAMQAVLNSQMREPYRCVLEIPANSIALLSRSLISHANLFVTGTGIIRAVGAPFTIIQHGDAGLYIMGEVHITQTRFECNGGKVLEAYFSTFTGAGGGKTCFIQDVTGINCGADAITLVNPPRTMRLDSVTLWANSYTYGSGFRFVAQPYPVGTVGNDQRVDGASFSYTLTDCQTSNFEWGFEWDLKTDTSPQSYFSPGGKMEGVVVLSCRAYNGYGFAKVTNSFNLGNSYNYGSPLWTFRDCDYQGWGQFLELSGLTDVIIDGNWLAMDQGNPIADNREIPLINLSFCDGATITHNHFGVVSTGNKSSAIKCVKTDGFTSKVLVADNVVSCDVPYDCFVHWGAVAGGANPPREHTNIERGTRTMRPTQPTVWCRDDGGNQISEGRILRDAKPLIDTGEGVVTLLPNGRTRLTLSYVGLMDWSGVLSKALPAGLFRETPRVVSAMNGDYGAFGQLGGFRSDFTNTSNVSFQFQNPVNGAAARVNMVLEGY
ncbi:hypothetical protein [Methylobacterium ajmalii]|uniref:hypothetical protein n=1 Tax=Methylobacterium ajmalii TaxID=2738439 RepID=UPI002F35014D